MSATRFQARCSHISRTFFSSILAAMDDWRRNARVSAGPMCIFQFPAMTFMA